MKQFETISHQKMAIWAAECAEHVLAYFEEEYPQDSRPHDAVEAARAWTRGEMSVGHARKAAFAAHASAREAKECGKMAACMAARAAGHAAATAHVPGHAAHAAAYAARAAELANPVVPLAGQNELDWQKQQLEKYKEE